MSTSFRTTYLRFAPHLRRGDGSRSFTGLGAGLCLCLCASQLAAQPASGPRVAFNGFGTLALATSSERNADFVANIAQGKGPGHSERVSLALDSRLGGQLFARVSDRLAAVVQVVAEQNAHHAFAPALEWANLRYAATPTVSLRVGRIVAPMLLVSEYRKVSFASAWERPPVEMYALSPITAWDGVDVTYRRARTWTTSLNLAYGRTSLDVPAGRVEGERSWGANASVAHGAFTGRVATYRGHMRATILDPLIQGLRLMGPAGTDLADRYAIDDRDFTFASTGLEYDRRRWFTMAEIARFSSQTAAGTKRAGYVHAGIRWRALTPFATYARSVVLSSDTTAGLDLAALPPAVVPIGIALNAGLNTALQSSPSQQSLALGLRWDLRAGIALKTQLDRINVGRRSAGTFTNFQPAFQRGKTVHVMSVSTAFVF